MSAQLITQGWGAGLGIPITVSLPQFPNVAALPGVPQLARAATIALADALASVAAAQAALTIATPATSGAIWQATQAPPIWGVFTQTTSGSPGTAAIVADSLTDFGYRQEYKISNYPVQQGQFASYNKVLLPYESSVVLVKAGSVTERATFLQQINSVISSLNLFNIRTAEKTYQNANCTRVEIMRHGPEAANKITAELFFIQVVEVQSQYSSTSGTTDLSNSSVPSAIPTTNQGLTQGSTPPSAVQTSALAAVGPASATP